MIRLTIFIIALLLAVGAVEPSGPWLASLAVLSGLELFCWRRSFRPWRWVRPRNWARWSWAEEYDW